MIDSINWIYHSGFTTSNALVIRRVLFEVHHSVVQERWWVLIGQKASVAALRWVASALWMRQIRKQFSF